ncbi:MAG: DNA polymerase III subunit alpha [Spirochaetes bacterium]|nr:DNA polymerase III subunit alpha [Spirochaetota bacterium]
MPAQVVRHLYMLGYRVMALTDRNNLYGVHEFLEACKDLGVRPILGATIQKGPHEVAMLVKEEKGFSNLCRLLTRRMLQQDSFELIKELPAYSEGNAVLARDVELLEQWRGKVEDLFVWIRGLDRSLYQTAKRLGIPPVIAPEVLLYQQEDLEVHRVLEAIGRLGTIQTGSISVQAFGRSKLKDPVFLSTPKLPDRACLWTGFPAEEKEMESRFAVYPDALENVARLADQCRFQEIFRGFIFPRLPNALLYPHTQEKIPGFSEEETRKRIVARMLRDQVLAGAEERYGELSEGILERIEYELSIIQQKGFSEYFLVVADIVRRSPRTCGRGSAAASVVAYCLGITNVDPIKHNLYFERFLNLDRQDPPDIDVDFAWDERDAVIEDVFRQYGGEHCARVCNHVFYRFPSALRDTARVFGIPEGEITDFERKLRRDLGSWGSERGPYGNGKNSHEDKREGASIRKEEWGKPSVEQPAGQRYPSPWSEIVKVAKRITGLPRHLSVHSGGVVITPEPIDQYVPVERAEKGVPIVTWEKDGVEAAGLVKIDLLGNRSLAVIRDTLENLKRNGLSVGDHFRDPTTDPDTQALLARGDTIGVFYVESPAMRQLQAKTGKGDFEHLVIHSSIIRPAANRFINLYVRRLKGEPYQPLHPDLDRILSETYGILCYQEDVSKVARVLAGFSNSDADGLRKILSKKNKEVRLAQYREQFYEGALRRGVSRETIDAVWEMILSFEGYSFCKAHSASYAMVSFQSAYLKAHYPAEFMAAVLSNRGGYYTPAAYISEARRMGLTILGPDVNQSLYRYTGCGKEIRVGFVEVKGLHRETVETIVRERSRKPFQSVEDFGLRVDLVGEDGEALVSVGALDSVADGLSRTEQLWILLRTQTAKQKGNQAGRVRSLWYAISQMDSLPNKVPTRSIRALGQTSGDRSTLLPYSGSGTKEDQTQTRARWEAEYQRLGFLLEGHALNLWEPIPERYRKVQGKELPRHIGEWVEMVGWPVTSKEILTREGKPMEFVSFEDETAIFETVLFPKAYERYAGVLDEPRPVIIRGTVQEDLGAVAIHVEELSPLVSRKNRKER